MKRLIILSLLSLNICFLYGQTNIDSLLLKSSKVEISKNGDLYSTIYYNNIDTIVHILNLDIFKYYKLDSYDTELKKKVFTESTEGIKKTNELKSKRNNLLTQSFYIELYGYPIAYNLEKKTIDLTIQVGDYPENYSKYLNQLQIGVIIINHQNKCTLKKTKFAKNNWNDILETISLKLLDESIALKIEENRRDVRVLLFFSPTETTTYESTFFSKSYIQAKMNNIIIYNRLTKEMYLKK